MDPNVTSNEMSHDERMWGMFCHLSAFAAFVIPVIGSVLGPLVIWLIKREEMPFVDDQGKEALNFQITMLIASFVAFILVFVLIGIPLLFALGIFNIVVTIIGAVRANDGVRYRYPFALRLIT